MNTLIKPEKIEYFPIKISFLYCLIAGAWLLVAESISAHIAFDSARQHFQTLNSVGFILIMALFIFGLSKHRIDRMRGLENKLQNRLELMHIMLDTVPYPIFYKDLDGHYLECNNAFAEQIYNLPKEKIIGRTPFDFPDRISASEAEFHHEQDMKLARGNEIRLYESPIYCDDGQVHKFFFNKKRFFVAKGKPAGIVCIMTDTTKFEKQLQQTQKMEAIGTLASGIAHDFNNILSAIIGHTEMVMMRAEKTSSDCHSLLQVLNSADRAKNLIRQILTFTRQDRQEKRFIRMGPIVKEVLKLIRAGLPDTIDIRHHIQEDGLIMADPTQIHQVLMNLCTNAGQAMQKKGGTLEVSIEQVALSPDSKPEFQALKSGRYLKLTVKDTGDGISPMISDRIFEPFFTTKNVNEGTGLGLSVVHGIVKSHGGAVTVSSRLRIGTEFHVFLPEITGKNDTAKPNDKALPKGSENLRLMDTEGPVMEMDASPFKPLYPPGCPYPVRTEVGHNFRFPMVPSDAPPEAAYLHRQP